MMSQPGKQTIAMQILPNISRSKCNPTTIVVKLIEYNMNNIFLEKLYTKCDGETIPIFYFKKSKLSISMDPLSKFLYSLSFYYMPSWGISKDIKLSCWPLAFTSNEAFSKNKKRSGTSLPASCSTSVLKKKYLCCYILLTDQISLSEMSLFVKYWAICDCNCLLTRSWCHKFCN